MLFNSSSRRSFNTCDAITRACLEALEGRGVVAGGHGYPRGRAVSTVRSLCSQQPPRKAQAVAKDPRPGWQRRVAEQGEWQA